MVSAGGFILSTVRVADPKAISGIGSFLAFVGGFLFFASGRSLVGEFRRRKIYRDSPVAADVAEPEAPAIVVPEGAMA